MTDQPVAADGLDELSYAQLHERAFRLAQKRRDLSFFIDLYSHTRAAHAAATEGGSLGDISGSLMDLVEATREAFDEEPAAETEPLFRAGFIEYLRAHPQD